MAGPVGHALFALCPRWKHTPSAVLGITFAYSVLYALLLGGVLERGDLPGGRVLIPCLRWWPCLRTGVPCLRGERITPPLTG